MTSESPTAEEIARRAQELELVFLGLSTGIPAFFDPSLPVLQSLLRLVKSDADDLPVTMPDEQGRNEYLQLSAREIFSKMAQLRGDILADDFMTIGIMHGAVRIGDMISRGGHLSETVPLLQFARHFRNACAHGNRWHFVESEPRYLAIHRDLTLTADLHGKKAAWGNVSPRRYIEYLDDISNYFNPGMVPVPSRE